MGHDISAYIRTKSTQVDNSYSPSTNKVAYFRIGAFSTTRQRVFYGLLPKALDANAGVSGNGSTIDFTDDDIKQAIAACKYYMDDEVATTENLLGQDMVEADETVKVFTDVLKQLMPNMKNEPVFGETPHGEIREHIADVWKFHEDIISAYEDAKKNDDSAQIQIYFG
jgi:hypothetical protein